MGQQMEPESWVSWGDYLTKGIRSGRADVAQHHPDDLPPYAENWISAQDYFAGKRLPRQEAHADLFADQPEETEPVVDPAPPEAYETVYDAMAEVYSILGRAGAVADRLKELAAQDQQDHEKGLITLPERSNRALALRIIRDNHHSRLEAIADWYMENHFRVFEEDDDLKS